jgi:ribosome-associated protein
MPLRITENIIINEEDISFEYSRSSGPGGQNVNKVESAVTLRFKVSESSLPDDIKIRLLNSGDKRINSEGELLINSRESRSQFQNKQNALKKLIELLQSLSKPIKKRFATRATKASKERRIDLKKKRSETKRLRGRII